jgi:hypothetical protein
MGSVRKIFQIVLLVSLGVWGVSLTQVKRLPEPGEILPELSSEPAQGETVLEPFEVEKRGFSYSLMPKYSYELWGLVVADYDSENWLDIMHENDPWNTKDLCVVWGENAISGVYERLKFSHGEFTCFAKPKDRSDQTLLKDFKLEGLANNHLLPKDDEIYQQVKESKVGDQVYFKGHLVEYEVETPEGKAKRGTSTTREDRGNGACEVVFVEEFEVLKEGNVLWRWVKRVVKYGMGVGLVGWVGLGLVSAVKPG